MGTLVPSNAAALLGIPERDFTLGFGKLIHQLAIHSDFAATFIFVSSSLMILLLLGLVAFVSHVQLQHVNQHYSVTTICYGTLGFVASAIAFLSAPSYLLPPPMQMWVHPIFHTATEIALTWNIYTICTFLHSNAGGVPMHTAVWRMQIVFTAMYTILRGIASSKRIVNDATLITEAMVPILFAIHAILLGAWLSRKGTAKLSPLPSEPNLKKPTGDFRIVEHLVAGLTVLFAIRSITEAAFIMAIVHIFLGRGFDVYVVWLMLSALGIHGLVFLIAFKTNDRAQDDTSPKCQDAEDAVLKSGKWESVPDPDVDPESQVSEP